MAASRLVFLLFLGLMHTCCGWETYLGSPSEYNIINEMYTRTQAQFVCVSQAANLVVLNNPIEEAFVRALLGDVGAGWLGLRANSTVWVNNTPPLRTWSWIGSTQSYTAYSLPYWNWDTSCPYTYASVNRTQCTDWLLSSLSFNRPNNCLLKDGLCDPTVRGAADCVTFNPLERGWRDVACNSTAIVVCERPVTLASTILNEPCTSYVDPNMDGAHSTVNWTLGNNSIGTVVQAICPSGFRITGPPYAFCSSQSYWIEGFYCTACAPGTFTNSPNPQRCTDCSAGTYQPEFGGTTCISCATRSVQIGEEWVEKFVSCPDATFSITDGSSSFTIEALSAVLLDEYNCAVTASIPLTGLVSLPVGVSFVNVSYSLVTDTPNYCEARVTVVDQSGPTLSCPMASQTGAFIINATANTTYAFVNCLDTNPKTGIATSFTAACGQTGGLVSDTGGISLLTQSPSPSTPLPLGTTTIFFTATDTAGNVASCTSVVRVVDATPPSIQCPAQIVVPESTTTRTVSARVQFSAADVNGLSTWTVANQVGEVVVLRSRPFAGAVSVTTAAPTSQPTTRRNIEQDAVNVPVTVLALIDAYVAQVVSGTNFTLTIGVYDVAGNFASCSVQVFALQSQLSASLSSLSSLSNTNPQLGSQLQTLTQQADGMTAAQVGLLTSAITQYVAGLTVPNNNASNFSSVFQVLSNLGTLPRSSLSSPLSSDAALLRTAFLDFALTLANSSGTSATSIFNATSLQIKTVAVNSSLLNASSSRLVFSPLQSNFSLPPSSIKPTGSQFSVLFSMFRDDRFFPLPSNATVSVVTPVVDVTLSGASLNGSFQFVFVPTTFSSSTPYRCAYWTGSGWASTGMTSSVTATGVTCTSVHLTNFAVIVDSSSSGVTSGTHGTALSIITLIGCGLSIVGLLLTVLVHSYFAQLRSSVPSKLLLNLCAALLLALVFFILASQVGKDGAACKVWAIGLQYFFLAAIAWMVVEGVNMHAIIVIVLGLRMGLRLRLYHIAAWGIPAVIVGVTIAIAGPSAYGGSSEFCWIGPRWALIGGFLIPLGVCVAVNCILFILVVRSLHRASAQRRGTTAGLKQQSHAREIRAVVSISVLMGLTWLFAAFIETGESTSSLIFQYLFAIFVTLQGFAIFLLQCLYSDTVRDAIRQRVSTSTSSGTASTGTTRKLAATTTHLNRSGSASDIKSTPRLSVDPLGSGPGPRRLTAVPMTLHSDSVGDRVVAGQREEGRGDGYLVVLESAVDSTAPLGSSFVTRDDASGLALNPLPTDPPLSPMESLPYAGSNEASPLETRDFDFSRRVDSTDSL